MSKPHEPHVSHSTRTAARYVLNALVVTAVATAAVSITICYNGLYPHVPVASNKSPPTRWLATGGHRANCVRLSAAAVPRTLATAADTQERCWEVAMGSFSPISLRLWQTSRTKTISKQAGWAMQTWRQENPNMTITLHDDTEAAKFVQGFYGQQAHQIFQSFPLGVMRGDFWRYAVLYAYGGLYADTDTRCLKPVSAWFPPRRNTTASYKAAPMHFVADGNWRSPGGLDYFKLSWHDCNIVIAMENDVHFCQWIIASVPGHPILKEVLDLMLERAKQGINITYEHMVHHHTGPGIWTEAITNVLGLEGLNAAQAARAVWIDPAAYRRARSMGVCIVAASFWGTDSPQNAHNMFGSLNYQGSGYPRWQDERAKLQQQAKQQQ